MTDAQLFDIKMKLEQARDSATLLAWGLASPYATELHMKRLREEVAAVSELLRAEEARAEEAARAA